MLNMKRNLVKFTFATVVIFSSISLLGDNYKLEVSKTLDSNAEQSYYPDLVIPLTWNNYLSSSFEYRSGELTDERSSVSGGDTVSVNESIKHKRFKLNLLNYKVASAKASYFFGIGGALESFDKSQYGTYTSTLGDNYTNDITIDVLSLYLKA